MLITVQPDPNWQLSLAQLSPSLLTYFYSHKISCWLLVQLGGDDFQWHSLPACQLYNREVLGDLSSQECGDKCEVCGAQIEVLITSDNQSDSHTTPHQGLVIQTHRPTPDLQKVCILGSRTFENQINFNWVKPVKIAFFLFLVKKKYWTLRQKKPYVTWTNIDSNSQ